MFLDITYSHLKLNRPQLRHVPMRFYCTNPFRLNFIIQYYVYTTLYVYHIHMYEKSYLWTKRDGVAVSIKNFAARLKYFYSLSLARAKCLLQMGF